MKKLLTLFAFILISSLVFAQQSHLKVYDKVNQNNKGERKEYKPAPEANATIFNYAAKAEKEFIYNPANSPGQYDYDSNTYDELGWTTISVAETDVISGLSISYDWTTDDYPAEGSFHLQSPTGTSIIIADGEATGSYTKNISDFNGETMNGDWLLWIEDSWGDGGHQATNINFTLFPLLQYDFTLTVPDGEAIYAGESHDYLVTINNTGADNDNFTPSVDGTGSWAYELYHADGTTELTAALNIISGESADFIIRVTVDPAADMGLTDTQSFTVTSAEGGKAIESFDITTTALAALTLPISENFNSPDLPLGWTNEYVVDAIDWVANTQNGDGSVVPRSGSHMGWFIAGNGPSTKLVTPKLALGSEIAASLSFYYTNVNWFGDIDELRVYYKNSAEGEWVQIGLDYTAEQTTWTEVILALPNLTDDYYVAFEGASNWGRGVTLDDITITPPPDNDLGITALHFDPTVFVDSENTIEAVVENFGTNTHPTGVVITFEEDGIVFGTATTTEDIAYGESTIVEIQWIPNTIGNKTITAYVPADDNAANDSYDGEISVLPIGALLEDFNRGEAVPGNWSTYQAGGEIYFWEYGDDTFFFNMDDGFALIGSDVNGTAEMLVTPELILDGTVTTLEFLVAGGNNVFGVGGSSLQVKYSDDGATWTDIGAAVDMTVDQSLQHISVDLSAIPDGNYYFGFEVTSTFDAAGFLGWLGIDNVRGPIMANVANDDLAVQEVIYPTDIIYVGEEISIFVEVENFGVNPQTGTEVTLTINGTNVLTSNIGTLSYGQSEFVEYTWTAEAGLNEFLAELPIDDDLTNNSEVAIGVVADANSLAEGFEGTWPPANWTPDVDDNWIEWTATWTPQYEGVKSAAAGNPDGFTDAVLATPLVKLTGSEFLHFYSTIGNAGVGATDLDIVYSEDGVTWTEIVTGIVPTENMELYSVDLTAIPAGHYYLGFQASGSGDGTFATLLVIDHVIGPDVAPFATFPFATKFEVEAGWDNPGGTWGGYNEKTYEEGEWLFHSTASVRGTADESFDGSPYSFRDRGIFTATCNGIVNDMIGFSFQVRDWMDADTDRPVNISFDGGITWTEVGILNKAFYDEYQIYQPFVHYFAANQDFVPGEFMIEIAGGTGGNDSRINIGQFRALYTEMAYIDPVYTTYDIYNNYDVETNIIWGDATAVTTVEEGGAELAVDQFSVAADILTINADYFAGLIENDELFFTVNFDNGDYAHLTVEVTDLTPVVTWPTATNITYGQTLAESTLSDGSAHVPGDPTTDIPGTFSFVDPTISPLAGIYTADVIFVPTAYESNNPVDGTVDVTVEKATANITLSDMEYTYDGTDKSATVTTDPAGLTYDIEYTLDGIITVPNIAGSYDVEVVIVDDNYEGTAVDALLINKAPLSITANSFSKTEGVEYVFDGTEFSTTPADLFASDEVTTVTLTSDGADAGAAIGDYEIIISDAVGTGLDNYEILYVNGTLTVTDKITLTIDGLVADNKVYDGTNAATISDWGTLVGVIPGDDVALDNTDAVVTFNNSNVGNGKTVTVTGLDLTGADAVKYVINDQTTSADITAKDLFITAEDKVKVYGEVDPMFTVIYDGFVEGQDETVLGGTLEFNREVGEDVGTYLIAPFGLTSTNYNINYIDGSLEITPAALSITAEDKEKVYGELDPELTVVFDGFVFDEDETALGGTLIVERDPGEDVGTYVITASGLTSDNYDILYVEGTLEITPKELVITGSFTVLNKYYDGTVDATMDVNSLELFETVDGDDVALDNIVLEFADPNAGENIVVSIISAEIVGADIDNYTLSLDGAPESSADITQIILTVGGTFTVIDKYYDGTTDATISENNLELIGVINDEVVNLISVVAEFDSPEVGEDIVVFISSADIDGVDAGNYSLDLTGAPTTTANIMAITFTVTFSVDGENGQLSAEVDGEAIASGDEVVEENDVLFTAIPAENYKVAEWTVNGSVLDSYTELTYLYENLDQNIVVTVSFEEVVGISEVSDVDVSVFPNPARDKFTVESSEMINKIRLVNISGQVVNEINVDAMRTEINVSSLRTGIYFMQIHTSNGVTTERVQITR